MRIVENRLAIGWPGAVLFALAYGLCAAISLAFTQTADGIALIWPSSGVFVAGLLLLRDRPRMLLMVLIVPVSLAINLAFGASMAVAIAYTLANLAEGLIAKRIASEAGRGCGRFDNPQWVLRFTGAALTAATASAMVAAVTTAQMGDRLFVLSWLATVLLGILIVAPAIVTGLRIMAGQEPVDGSRNQIIAVAAFSACAIGVTFFQTAYPLLFVPLTATVLATYVLGVTGALAMMFAIALAGTISISIGTSPITFVDDPVAGIYFLQFYLLTIFASALPLATLLAKSRAQMREIAFRKAQHDAAQSFAHVGHWRYCLRSRTSEWSDGMFYIYGLDPTKDRPMNLEHGSIVSEDSEKVRAVLARAVVEMNEFTVRARIERADGTIRHVESLGDIEYSDGKAIAIFGVLKDVTDNVHAMEELERQKARAEVLARDAVLLSETDQLTRVANRRKLLTRLAEEIARADRSGSALSVMMIDVDHFKSVNDIYGHAMGDVVLCEIAALGERALRKGDLFGRLGGEEFLAILPETPGDVAAMVGERLRIACEELDWASFEGPESISISLGVAVHQTGADETFLLQAADAALYQSKNTGRNRLTLAA